MIRKDEGPFLGVGQGVAFYGILGLHEVILLDLEHVKGESGFLGVSIIRLSSQVIKICEVVRIVLGWHEFHLHLGFEGLVCSLGLGYFVVLDDDVSKEVVLVLEVLTLCRCSGCRGTVFLRNSLIVLACSLTALPLRFLKSLMRHEWASFG